MNNPVEYLFRVIDAQDQIHGMAFFITPRVALTCYHVIEECGVDVGGNVGLIREGDKQRKIYLALVERTNETEDVAMLVLCTPPGKLATFVLGPSENTVGRDFY